MRCTKTNHWVELLRIALSGVIGTLVLTESGVRVKVRVRSFQSNLELVMVSNTSTVSHTPE